MRATFPGLVLSFNLLLMATSCMPAAPDAQAPDPDRSERGSGGKSSARGGSGGSSGNESTGGSQGEGSGGSGDNTGGAVAVSGGVGGGRSPGGSGGSIGSGGSTAAASGGAGGASPSGRPDGAAADTASMTAVDAAAAGPTFTKLWTDLLLPTCGTAACHGRKGPPDGIDMHTQMTAYATLMAKAITKGDPVKSKVVTLIEAKKMPPGGKPAVSAQQIADLKAWITGGAVDN